MNKLRVIQWTTGKVGKLGLRGILDDPEWDIMTAMPAVSAALNVAAAPPGILTLKDVGLPCAPAGIWLEERNELASTTV
jgi:hypothetical protein